MNEELSTGVDSETNLALTPQTLVRMIRGFGAVFWGLPISLLLFFGAVEVHLASQVRLPSCIAGLVVVYVGLVLLRFSGLRAKGWARHARNGLISTFLLIYLGPFIYWYTYLPPSGAYYMLNMGLFSVSVILLLFSVNRLAAELGHEAHDRDLMVESRLCGWSVILLMFLPTALTAVFSSYMAMKYESSLLAEMRGVRRSSPLWIHIFFLIPLSLTMTSAWKAKEKCITLLKTSAGP